MRHMISSVCRSNRSLLERPGSGGRRKGLPKVRVIPLAAQTQQGRAELRHIGQGGRHDGDALTQAR